MDDPISLQTKRVEPRLGDEAFVQQSSRPAALPEASAVNCVADLAGAHYRSVLKALHKELRPKSYFEIGTSQGGTLSLAECASLAVDPKFHINQNVFDGKRVCALYQMTSDEFFAEHDPKLILGGEIELAFLDGMHLCEVLLRDFANAERHCRKDSVIVLHDCVPTELPMTDRTPGHAPIMPHRRGWWTGDVWRTVLALKRFRPDLDITALDAAPTGLVCVTNLNPRDRTLVDRYAEIVQAMASYALEKIGIDKYFSLVDLKPTSVYFHGKRQPDKFVGVSSLRFRAAGSFGPLRFG